MGVLTLLRRARFGAPLASLSTTYDLYEEFTRLARGEAGSKYLKLH